MNMIQPRFKQPHLKLMSLQRWRESLILLPMHKLFYHVEYTSAPRLSHTQAFTRRVTISVYTGSVHSVLSHSSDLWNVLPVRIRKLKIFSEFHDILEPFMRNFHTDSPSPQNPNCTPLSHSGFITDFPSPHNRTYSVDSLINSSPVLLFLSH